MNVILMVPFQLPALGQARASISSVCLLPDYLTSLHVTRSPGPSPIIHRRHAERNVGGSSSRRSKWDKDTNLCLTKCMCITASLTPFSDLHQTWISAKNVKSGESAKVKFQMVALLMYLMVDCGVNG